MTHTALKTLALSIALSLPALAAVPDGLITTKAKLSLWTSPGVRSTTVHVDTNDGVITLYGKLPTVEQKAAAEKTASAINGARGVRNLLQVVPLSQEKIVERSDKDLKAQAEKTLKADASLKDSKITVKSVDKGVALITGDARTLSDQLRAVVLVDRLEGMRGVVSETKGPLVFGKDERIAFDAQPKQPETRSATKDMRISAAVKLRMLTAAQVPASEISVDTEDSVVTLFGIVPTTDVRNAAVSEAMKVSGVLKVDNQLEVVASAQKKAVDAKDDDITRDLALAFKDRPELNAVKTVVKNGKVQITGTISSGWDQVNAVRTVRNVAGVRGVEDQLKIDDKS